MFSKRFSSQAIVLSQRDYGEADRIVILFTQNHGKLSFLAKGVRKPKSRKRGNLEVFNLIKFSGTKPMEGLGMITEVDIVENFPQLRTDLKKMAVGYFLLETIQKITRDDEKHEIVFGLLHKYLYLICETDNIGALRKSFITEVLIELGFWPGGSKLSDPDGFLEDILEKRLNSVRVGKRILQ